MLIIQLMPYCRVSGDLKHSVFESQKVQERFHKAFYVSSPPFGDICRRTLYRRLFVEGVYPYVFEQEQGLASEYDLEMEFPFFDEEVIDFSLRLPLEARFDGKWGKRPLRLALKRYLSDQVAFPRTTQAYNDLVSSAIKGKFNALSSYVRGGLAKDLVSSDALRAFKRMPIEGKTADALLSVLNVEKRLRSLEHGKIKQDKIKQKEIRNAQTL